MKKLSILFVLTLTLSSVQSQITKNDYKNLASSIPGEKTELLVNKTVLLSGEFLYYQAYTLNLNSNAYSQVSKMLYIELLNAEKESLFQQKLKVKDNVASGELFIPAALETGHYKLIAYTNWSKNNVKDYFDQVDIFIINPFTKRTQFNSTEIDSSMMSSIQLKADSKDVAKQDFKNPNFKLNLNKNSFKTRELVTASISNTNLLATTGSYNINVRKIAPISLTSPLQNLSATNPSQNSYYLPELRGEIISGTVIDKVSKNPLVNKTVSISFPDKTFILKIAQSNAAGKFYFTIDKNYDIEDAIIQITDLKVKNYAIILDTKDLVDYGDLKFTPLILESNIKEWLEKRSIETQIENSYFEIKSDSLITTKDDHVFFGDVGATYILDDYTRFPSLRQTFIEVVSTAFITKRNDFIEFSVPDLPNLDFNRNFSHLKPLVLMDGIAIINNDDIINYSANRIESITVITGVYLYGPELYHGVISIASFDRAFTLPNTEDNKTFEMIRPVSNKSYYQPDYSNSKTNTIPDYRSQLLWKPYLKLDQAESDFEFYTSDSKGTYQITLEGYSKNGIYSLETIYFEVE